MYKILIFNDIEGVTQEELNAEMQQLPAWRLQNALFYRFFIDRVLSVKAFLLLKKGLFQMFGFKDNIEFDYLYHGKPVIKGYSNMKFNLSHCKKGVLCVVADHEIGCDIEEIVSDSIDMALLHYCFNETERNEILSAKHPGIMFTRFWTIKEAVLKLTGEGINDNLPTLLSPQLLSQLTIVTKEVPEKSYVYSLAYYKSTL